LDRPYEALMRSHYSHAAVLEFDDIAGLRAYLDHPAHTQLASRFFESFEEALIYDYELEEGAIIDEW
jgi:Stress responsive A/B Barrel Domain